MDDGANQIAQPLPLVSEGGLHESVYVEHVQDDRWKGWLIGQRRDNPCLARVVWVEPQHVKGRMDTYNTQLLRRLT